MNEMNRREFLRVAPALLALVLRPRNVVDEAEKAGLRAKNQRLENEAELQHRVLCERSRAVLMYQRWHFEDLAETEKWYKIWYDEWELHSEHRAKWEQRFYRVVEQRDRAEHDLAQTRKELKIRERLEKVACRLAMKYKCRYEQWREWAMKLEGQLQERE